MEGGHTPTRGIKTIGPLHCSAVTSGVRTEAHLDFCELLLRFDSLARIDGVSPEEKLLRFVVKNATEGDPESVLRAIHTFCAINPMMHVGETKGRILDQTISRHEPKIAVEFGAYCGYSAVRTARLLPPGGHLYSIEFNPLFAAISTKMVEFAGLSDRVTVIIGTVETKLQVLRTKYNVQQIDLHFIDHWKELYVPDLKRAEQLNYLKRGSVIVADNILIPGAPEYVAYVRNSQKYSSTFYKIILEYSTIVDGVEVSVVEN